VLLYSPLATCYLEQLLVVMASFWPKRMIYLAVLVILIGCCSKAEAAYSVVCFVTGSQNCDINYQVTKDCCTAVANGQKGWKKAQQHFDEPSWNCLSNLVGGNSVNDGDVAKC